MICKASLVLSLLIFLSFVLFPQWIGNVGLGYFNPLIAMASLADHDIPETLSDTVTDPEIKVQEFKQTIPIKNQVVEKVLYGDKTNSVQPNAELFESDSGEGENDVQFAQAQIKGCGVEVIIVSPKIVEVEPGKIVTATFQIKNNSDRQEEFFDSLNLPSGWHMITPLSPIKLGPFEKQIKIIAFSVPAIFPEGEYPLKYSVMSQGDFSITDNDVFSVVVLPNIKIDIILEDKPEKVIAGDVFFLRMRILNHGNTKTKLRLFPRAAPEYPVIVKPSDLILDAGKSQLVHMEVKSDKTLNHRTTHFLTIQVQEGEGVETREVAVLTIETEIIPWGGMERDLYGYFSGQISFIGVAEDDNKGHQLEITGSGSLDEQGEKNVDFLIRSPNTQDISIFAMPEEYKFKYTDSVMMLAIGDKNFFLSPLTAFNRYGRGAEINISPGAFEAGAYYLKNRWKTSSVNETGAFISYQHKDYLQLRGNLLNKVTRTNTLIDEFHDRIYSLQGRLSPNEMFNFGLEYGLCPSKREKNYSDHAYRIDFKGNLSDQAWYTFEKTRAGPKFFGYYNDADYTTGTLTFPIYLNFRGNVSYRRAENNIDRDPLKTKANQEISYRAGVAYTTSFNTAFSLDYEDFHRKDRLLPSKYNFNDKVMKLGISQEFNRFTIKPIVEAGKRNDRLLLPGFERKTIERYSLYSSFYPTGNQNYSFYARSGHEQYFANLERSKSAGASMSWKLNDTFIISTAFEKKYIHSGKKQEQDSLNSTMSYKLPNDHYINFKGRWVNMKGSKEDQAAILISYDIPLAIPFGRSNNSVPMSF